MGIIKGLTRVGIFLVFLTLLTGGVTLPKLEQIQIE
jgi:hypothetical protein